MKPFKACTCRDPQTGKFLGKKCPNLRKRGHGKWYARYEAPRTPDGKRRQPRIGPFDTETECKQALVKVLGEAGKTGKEYDRKITLGEYLEKRHAWRTAAAETGDLKPSTLEADREAIDLYLKPGLGHLKMADQLGQDQIRDLYAAMRLINRDVADSEHTEMLRRLLAARAKRDGRRYSTRPLSEARIRRVHAVLTGALNDAVKVSKIIPSNPAEGVFRGKGASRRKGRLKPLLWTEERVEHWLKTGEVPGKVMVWTSTQCGAFLDFAEHDRLYALWHFGAYWGLRRGELVGLDKKDISLNRRRCHVRQAQRDDELDDVKSEESNRIIVFDEDTARVLTAWQQQQRKERLAWGEAYTDSGRFFTYEDGRALRPAYVSQRFDLLIERYNTFRSRFDEGWSAERIARRHRTPIDAVRIALEGPPLPPIRFHDLRHGAATMLLAAGVDLKVVSEILGHATMAFTGDVYAVVAENLAEDAAATIAAFVPRRKQA
ncbi:tyrosine-type recombinase/integrase [Actinomadura sp. NPDC047616]|uniref:tyrosine-type recombinase/integrase n=1 Tax=Actinomadura sp. NPDC047616 TaxID=3155914 RepID=UPI003404E263